MTIGPYWVSSSGSLARTLRTGSTTGRFEAKRASSRVSPASACSTYTMSAWSIPCCGRPLNVSSIFTPTTAPAGGLPIPVNGLVGGIGLGLGLGLALGVGGTLEEGVGVGVDETGAATGRDVSHVAATPIPTPATTTTAALTAAITFCLVLRARMRSSAFMSGADHEARGPNEIAQRFRWVVLWGGFVGWKVTTGPQWSVPAG